MQIRIMQTPFFFLLLLFLFCAAVCQSSLCEDEVILVVLVKKNPTKLQQKSQACVTDELLFTAFNIC